MNGSVDDRAAALFLALAEVPPASRTSWLATHCGSDQALRDEVERMLAALDPDTCSSHIPVLGRAQDRPDMPLGPGTIIGDFTIVGPIGSGATGVVYLARQHHPNRTVALKTLRRGLEASTARRRFEVEAELLAQLQHPGIAHIYASHPGNECTPPYIAMELVDGPPLTEYVEQRNLSRFERLELVARVSDAVQHAHHRGIIHRDLKPPNILVGADGQPKVLDFGVARVVEGAQISLTTLTTGPGQLVGTLPYMSPEQVEATADGADTRTDVYSLGVILFRLLVGRLPFTDDDPPVHELGRRIVFDPPPRLGAIDSSLRGDLETIVSRALAKERDRRYTSPAALASDLRRFMTGLPIAASADSAWYVLRKQVARYRRALLASTAVALALVGVVTYATVQRTQATRANIQLAEQLTTSNIERARLSSMAGYLSVAEELAWRELFRQPDSMRAQWMLWQIYAREPSVWTRTIHPTGTQTVRFSPDGRTILTGGRVDGLIHLLDADSGRIVKTLASHPASGIRRAFFTENGTTVVSGHEDGSLRVWDVTTGQPRLEVQKAIPRVWELATDGNHVLAVGTFEGVQVWSLAAGRHETTLEGIGPNIWSVAVDSHGTLVVAGSDDGRIGAWNLAARKLLWQVQPRPGVRIRAVAIHPQRHIVVSGGSDGIVDVWDAGTGERQRSIPFDDGTLNNFAYDPAGSRLAAGGFFRTRVWDAEPLTSSHDLGGSEGTSDLHFRPDGLALVACDGGNGRVRLWHLAADSRAGHAAAGIGRITGLAASGEEPSIVTAGTGGMMMWRPFDAADPDAIAEGQVFALAESGNRRWLVTAGAPSMAAIWNAHDGRRLATLGDAKASRAVSFSEDNGRVYIGERDGTLAIWDWANGTASGPRRVKSGDSEILALTSARTRVYSGHRNGLLTMYEAHGSVVKHLATFPSSPFSLAVSRDARMLAAGTFRGVIYLLNLETGHQTPLKGQGRTVGGLDFSPDGRLLASVSRDGATQLWDVATGQPLAIVGARAVGAERVRFLPDGRRLAVGYADGEVEIRDLYYFFRHAAGQAEYQLELIAASGESFPRAQEVIDWSRRLLAGPGSANQSLPPGR